MEIGSLFLILALLLLVGVFVGRPIIEKEAPGWALTDAREHQRSVLLAERDRLLTAIKELEFDHQLGKIPEEEYPRQRAMLMERGADVLQALDELRSASGTALLNGGSEDAVAEPLGEDNDRQQRLHPNGFTTLKTSPVPETVSVDDELEALIAQRRRSRKDKAVGFCPQCGAPLQKSDHYCPKCGGRINLSLD